MGPLLFDRKSESQKPSNGCAVIQACSHTHTHTHARTHAHCVCLCVSHANTQTHTRVTHALTQQRAAVNLTQGFLLFVNFPNREILQQNVSHRRNTKWFFYFSSPEEGQASQGLLPGFPASQGLPGLQAGLQGLQSLARLPNVFLSNRRQLLPRASSSWASACLFGEGGERRGHSVLSFRGSRTTSRCEERTERGQDIQNDRRLTEFQFVLSQPLSFRSARMTSRCERRGQIVLSFHSPALPGPENSRTSSNFLGRPQKNQGRPRIF